MQSSEKSSLPFCIPTTPRGKDELRINEVFKSIQGESTWAGVATSFVRTTGCNLRCSYCDTKYSYVEGSWRSFESLFAEIEGHKTKYVCVTGGEPLLQESSHGFMSRLCDRGYRVSLETSGSISCLGVDTRVCLILDVKTPDSGAADSFLLVNLEAARGRATEFKFVISSDTDFVWSEEFSAKHQLHRDYAVLYSPAFGRVTEKWLAERILERNSMARLHLQLHKYIWSPDQRGV